MDPRPDPAAPTPADWLARCPACGRADPVPLANVARLMRAGGPECCGRPMTWYVRAGGVGPPTPAPHPRRPPAAK